MIKFPITTKFIHVLRLKNSFFYCRQGAIWRQQGGSVQVQALLAKPAQSSTLSATQEQDHTNMTRRTRPQCTCSYFIAHSWLATLVVLTHLGSTLVEIQRSVVDAQALDNYIFLNQRLQIVETKEKCMCRQTTSASRRGASCADPFLSPSHFQIFRNHSRCLDIK